MEQRRRIGAYGVACDEWGQVLFARLWGRSSNAGRWILPGGGLDHGEDPRLGVIREFREETGLEVEVTRLRTVFSDLVEFRSRGVLLHHDRVIFDVRVIGGTLLAERYGSTDLAMWVSPDDIVALDLVPFTAKAIGLSTPDSYEINERPADPDESGEVAKTGHALSGARQVTRFGAYGIVRDDQGRVLLSLISDAYPGGGTWHLPGGGTDFGEQPAEGLLREIYEESAQSGEVTGLVRVGSRHNPAALGPEGEALDWYTVRAVFTVRVPEPTEPRVTEAAGGSTARSRWFTAAELVTISLSDLARRELLHIECND